MELTVRRCWKEGDATVGDLLVNGEWACYTLEDEVRGTADNIAEVKIPGKTAIPAGRYQVLVTFSQRFQRMLPILLDVPSFSGVRIHSGNTASSTEGCLLIGEVHEFGQILRSRAALNALLPKIGAALSAGEGCWIEVRDTFEEVPA